MREIKHSNSRKHLSNRLILVIGAALALSSYVDQVSSLPAGLGAPWPTFPRRNVAALARDGVLRGSLSNLKRSISTLAKNGQLPTFRSPYDETDKQDQDDDESHEKRNLAAIARLRSFGMGKRNVQALARDGYRIGRGQVNQQTEKRNIQALARNGQIHMQKKDFSNDDQFYYPFYQNPIPPVSEMDGPFDYSDLYDLQQSVNPDMFPPLSQVYKRSTYQDENDIYGDNNNSADLYENEYLKRGTSGMPFHGLMRPSLAESNYRTKRYILSLPDVIERNDLNEAENEETENDKRSVDDESELHDNFEKRHIGSLARKHSYDENFGIRQHISGAEVDSAADPDDPDVPAAAVPPHTHPTGRILHRPLNNDLPNLSASPLPVPSQSLHPPSYNEVFSKNRWQSNTKEVPKFYYFRSLKVPYHTSGKRYLLLPAVDNIMLRKTYPNSSLPSRRKNQ